jgi:hypothetical protein
MFNFENCEPKNNYMFTLTANVEKCLKPKKISEEVMSFQPNFVNKSTNISQKIIETIKSPIYFIG